MPTYNLTASEFIHEISPARNINAWGFNGSLPGPVLRAKKGDTLTINVTNELPEPTLIHWHGIQLPAKMDGTEEVQKPIMPGETFQYSFTAPDAGTFWYHSHYNETVQMERGMYGAIVIEDDHDPLSHLPERLFVFDDMKIDEKGEWIKGNALQRWIERHDGREGNTLLINGKENPLFTLLAGQPERWRFVNASSARYIDLSFSGKTFSIISSDGGRLEKPVETTHVLMTPGERIEILIEERTAGRVFGIETLPYNRMTMGVKARRRSFGSVEVVPAEEMSVSVPAILRTIQPLVNPDAEPTRKITFSVGASVKRGIDFLVNNEMHAHDRPVKKGELQIWEVRNTSLMDHPFHLHGFFFQVLQINGRQPEVLAWKDTVNLPPRSSVKIAWMPDREGEWMYHCHILEHHAAGMMGHFEVVE
jgi:FtsP/CotA-like multicopper oxidase with cupredoxin domain